MNRLAQEPNPSDAELARHAQAGTASAFDALVRRYQDRVYNMCYRMTHNHADALDLTQTAFLKALQALPRFEWRSSFYTWLFRIVVNLTISHRRRPRLARLDDEAELRGEIASRPNAGPSARLEGTELSERLEAALTELDEEFRVAVLLRDVEGLDYETIGEIVGAPVGTVKSRIHRGRESLRAALLREGLSHAE